MRLLAVCGLGRVIAIIGVALLFRPAHFLSMPLLVNAPLIFEAALLFKSPGFGRGPPIRVPRRCRWTTVSVVIHASARILRGLLLDGLALLIGPVTHPLWWCRWRTTVMIPMHLRRHTGLGWVRHARLWASVAGVLMMLRRVMRLMLRVRRLGGWHAAFMHAHVVPRAVRAVEHGVGLWRAIDTRWLLRCCRWGASVVGVRHALARLWTWGRLLRL
jgi:hypothetical protein